MAKSKSAPKGDSDKANKPNKAEAIRQAAKALGPNAQRRDVIAKLKEQGIVVSSAQVSMTLKAAGIRRKRRRLKMVARGRTAADNVVSRAELIRQTARALGKRFRPRDIIAKLREANVEVSSTLVSKTLHSAGFRRRRRARRAIGAGAGPPRKPAGNGLDLGALLAAKALIEKVGGIERAQEAIGAIKRLG